MNRQQNGLTLIEQIAMVVVLAILATIAVPALSQTLRRHPLRSAPTDVVAAVNFARGHAIPSGRKVRICPSLNGLQRQTSTRVDPGWAVGYFMAGSNPKQIEGTPWRAGGGHDQLTILLRAAHCFSNPTAARAPATTPSTCAASATPPVRSA